jgi:hypothetical protein
MAKSLLRFSLMMLPEAAKNARKWETKWRSLSDSLSQSAMSAMRLISSAVQKDASAFLYICQMSAWCMGKSTKQCGSSCSSGLGARSLVFSGLVFCWLLGWGGCFLSFPRGMGCVSAEFVPIVALVANEVGDLTEGLVHDGMLDGHGLVWRGGGGEGGVFDK